MMIKRIVALLGIGLAVGLTWYFLQKPAPIQNVPVAEPDFYATFQVCDIASSNKQVFVSWLNTGDEGESSTEYYSVKGKLIDETETCGAMEFSDDCEERATPKIKTENCVYTTREFFEEHVPHYWDEPRS